MRPPRLLREDSRGGGGLAARTPVETKQRAPRLLVQGDYSDINYSREKCLINNYTGGYRNSRDRSPLSPARTLCYRTTHAWSRISACSALRLRFSSKARMTAALYTCAWRSRSACGSQCDSPGPYTLYPSAAAWSSLAKPGPTPVRAMSSARRRASGSSLKCSNAAASPGCRSGCSCSALRRYAYVETKVAQTRPADAPECSERQIAPECSEHPCSERGQPRPISRLGRRVARRDSRRRARAAGAAAPELVKRRLQAEAAACTRRSSSSLRSSPPSLGRNDGRRTHEERARTCCYMVQGTQRGQANVPSEDTWSQG
eukprot:scaffold93544_cov72-Phaeocystis_antarctica.AAC.2